MIALVSMGFILIGPGLVRAEEVEPPEIVLPSDEVLRTEPQVLRNASTSDPKTFNLVLANETSSTDVLSPLFESLVRMNPITLNYDDEEYSGVLAVGWEVDETGRIWTFHLREGVKWNDGEPFTAEDVVFTLKVIYDPDIPNSTKDILSFGKDKKQITCEKIDDHTVKFTTPEPFAPFLHNVGGMSILPKHILNKPWEEKDEELSPGQRFNQMWTIGTKVNEIVGTGPYVITEYIPTQHIKFGPNPYYWRRDEKGRRLPYIERIETIIVENLETISLKFKAHEIDTLGLRPKDVALLGEEIRKQEEKGEMPDKVLLEVGLSTGTTFVAFNQNPRHYIKDGKVDPRLNWFSDPQFMKAIAMSIDYETIIQNVLYGLGVSTSTVISPVVRTFHHDGLEAYKYNLDKARQILDQAGYKVDDKGVRRDKNGNKIKFTLITNSGNDTRESISNILVADWTEELGFEVHYQPLEFNTLVKKLLDNFDWDAVVIGLTGGVEPHGGANVYKSSGQLHFWNPEQESPTTEWEKEVDALVDRGAKELDLEKRIEIYKRMQEIFYRRLSYIMLPVQKIFIAHHNKLKNYRPLTFGTYKSEYRYIDTRKSK